MVAGILDQLILAGSAGKAISRGQEGILAQDRIMAGIRVLVAGMGILEGLVLKISLVLDLVKGSLTPGHTPGLGIPRSWFVQ